MMEVKQQKVLPTQLTHVLGRRSRVLALLLAYAYSILVLECLFCVMIFPCAWSREIEPKGIIDGFAAEHVNGRSTGNSAVSSNTFESIYSKKNDHHDIHPDVNGRSSSRSNDNIKEAHGQGNTLHQTKHHGPSKLRSPRDRPNFVILFMDDLGYGDVGFGGHPTTLTPNIDTLAHEGKVLTTWYSGCSVCTGSRGALMTGRQYPRIGLPGVLGPVTNVGLPLNETTFAEQLKKVGYATAIVGKWHLGQRKAYLPANHGFDYYLGIPYSDDMGNGIRGECSANNNKFDQSTNVMLDASVKSSSTETWPVKDYERSGFLNYQSKTSNSEGEYKGKLNDDSDDPAGIHLPLVYQGNNDTQVVEQPLDFSTIADKYNAFSTNFIQKHSHEPFLLYAPFSHVHTTSNTQPNHQYAGCSFQNQTKRGPFGDALKEADWMIGNIHKALEEQGVLENTLILFASDNGPNVKFGLSAGSAGLLTGRYANYWNTAKGSTWEGGIREPAFAYWKNQILPHSRSSAIVSSLDVLPTLSALAGVPLPVTDDGLPTTIDGRDMSHILLNNGSDGKKEDDEKITSHHEFLFFYGTCRHGGFDRPYEITAVRHEQYKAHWCTGPGLGGDTKENKIYQPYPLLFDIEHDPSESIPISEGEMPVQKEHAEAMERIMKAYAFEKSTFVYGQLIPEPDEKDEGPSQYGVCCDRAKQCDCSSPSRHSNDHGSNNLIDYFLNNILAGTKDTVTSAARTQRDATTTTATTTTRVGLLNIGTKKHHDIYHDILGEEEPSPPVTQAQLYLRGEV